MPLTGHFTDVMGRKRFLLICISGFVVASALCDHERLATLPLGSGMRYFAAELDAHLLRSSCPAGVCQPIKVPAGRTPKTPVKAS